MNKIFKPPVLLTEGAISEFKKHIKNNISMIFVVGVISNKGCSGNKYLLKDEKIENINSKLYDLYVYNFEEKIYKEFEKIDNNCSITFAIDKFSLFKLIGSKIDFAKNDKLSKGFFFINPNETGRCGCGQSFSA